MIEKTYLPDTELRNARSINIDEVDSSKILQIINDEDKTVAHSVEKEIDNIALCVDAAEKTIRNGGRIIYMGCGTSGRLGVLDASECPPTYNVPEDFFVGIIAGGDGALRKSSEGAEDHEAFGVTDLKSLNFTKKDMLIGIAASGRTPYVIGGLKYAKTLNAETACIVCSRNSPIEKLANVAIVLETGPEAITGSTRMKAGTAQKMALNMVSTGTMVKLGKVYGNLMVDLRPTNSKLIKRAERIICEVTGCSEEQAKKYFLSSGYDVKVAAVMITKGLNQSDADALLEKNNGILKKALN